MTAPLDYPDEREIRFEEAAQGHDAVLRRGAEGSGVKDCILALALDDFLSLDIRPRETILAPWLPRCGLAMIHAPRGLGKTQVAIGTAWAMASGGNFLRWRCDKAWRVLFLDGEMPGWPTFNLVSSALPRRANLSLLIQPILRSPPPT